MELLRQILGDTISIFTIMNPLAAGVIMLSLIHGDTTKSEIHKISVGATKTVLIALLVLFLGGVYIFSFLGISSDGLRLFGGIILSGNGF
ncbi:MAG: MarC family protein [Owenweeksia sp.]|nr:MarC family protein [Owenweeksia sp.]